MSTPETLLIVDDEEANRDLLSRRLERSGFTIAVADSGYAALERLKNGPVDLVLLDSTMPGISGIEVLRRLRQSHTADELPIIMVTAVSDSARVAEALDLGANDYVTKPVDFTIALARIRSQLSRKRAESALRSSQERLAMAVRGANDGLWDWDLRSGVIHYSDRWKTMLGFAPDEIENQPDEWFSRVHKEDRPNLHAALERHWHDPSDPFECEYRMLEKSGTYRWMLARGMALPDAAGTAVRMAGSQSDITGRKTLDPLTRLPNRLHFLDRLEAVLERMRREPGFGAAVLYLDLDRFKLVNDSLGSKAGDQLLVESANRLRTAVREIGEGESGPMLARLGGDEFAVLIEGTSEATTPARAGERILKVMRPKIQLAERSVYSSFSIGIAPLRADHGFAEDVLRDAGTAMYAAKSLGPARMAVFDREMHERITARMQLELDLQSALEHNQLVVYYQPRIELATNRIRGFEALLRWIHPERGVINPADFIPAAEESGQIVAIGLWVLRQACMQLCEWQTKFPQSPPLEMAVNVSPAQCRETGFVDRVSRILVETGVNPAHLQLEITESVLMENLTEAKEVFDGLRELGIGLKIDDFGTGYSCLQYLSQLPFDMLKIDRSFTAALASGEAKAEELVKTIVALAHNVKLEVVAEGIETQADLDKLKAMGCGFGQGFYFSRPLDRTGTEALLKREAIEPGATVWE